VDHNDYSLSIWTPTTVCQGCEPSISPKFGRPQIMWLVVASIARKQFLPPPAWVAKLELAIPVLAQIMRIACILTHVSREMPRSFSESRNAGELKRPQRDSRRQQSSMRGGDILKVGCTWKRSNQRSAISCRGGTTSIAWHRDLTELLNGLQICPLPPPPHPHEITKELITTTFGDCPQKTITGAY